MTVMIRREVEALAQRFSPPSKSLEQILTEHAQKEKGTELCEDCGGLVERPTGLPVCPETALRTAFHQVRFLGEARAGGAEDLFELFDDLDEELFEHYEKENALKERERTRWEEQRDELQVLRETCRWLIEQEVEDIGSARSLLLAMRHGWRGGTAILKAFYRPAEASKRERLNSGGMILAHAVRGKNTNGVASVMRPKRIEA
jgi:hypothetical protein